MGGKGRNSKNSRKNNRRKNGKNKNQKNKGSKKGGVFGGLQGAFGGDQQSKGKNSSKSQMEVDDDRDSDDMVEEVECHSVDGNPKATPASANNYYDQDDSEGDGVQCRQM